MPLRMAGETGRGHVSYARAALGWLTLVENRSVSDELPAAARWERHARWWQEAFTDGADAEYTEQILPLTLRWLAGRGPVLDIGCGEGQVARAVARVRDGPVVGADPTGGQLTVARQRGGGPQYVQAAAGALPFAESSFRDVMACLVFEHIADLDGALAEVARVLLPAGHFVLFLNHPLLQTPNSGWIDDHVLDPPEQYWRIGPYLEEDMTLEEVAPGVELEFWHRPLSRYVNGLSSVGLVVTHLDEPPPPPGFLARAPEYPQAATIPRLLMIVAEKRS